MSKRILSYLLVMAICLTTALILPKLLTVVHQRQLAYEDMMRKKQSRFALNVAMLILEAEKRGYEITLGDAYRDPRANFPYSHPKSNHMKRLAIDLNLFKDGEYITDAEGHDVLHDWWVEYCGGAEMIDNDPNHYSFEHEGVI